MSYACVVDAQKTHPPGLDELESLEVKGLDRGVLEPSEYIVAFVCVPVSKTVMVACGMIP
jgi:hypothetical protein